MNKTWLSLAALALSGGLLPYDYKRTSPKTPDLPLPEKVKSKIELETIEKAKQKRLKREQNRERDRKK